MAVRAEVPIQRHREEGGCGVGLEVESRGFADSILDSQGLAPYETGSL